jgi:hypothetical protein
VTVLLLMALAGHAPAARGQELGLSVVHLRSDHELLESSTGFGFAVGARLSSRLGVRLGYQDTSGSFAATGSTCAGLIAPDEDCADEPRADQARTRSVLLSAPLTLRDDGRLGIAVVPGLQWTSVTSEQLGERTGRTRRASKANPGVALGLELQVRPERDGPLAVVLSGGHSLLDPLRTEHIADGYTPFEQRIGLTRFSLGLVFRR